jgi:glutamine synthetase
VRWTNELHGCSYIIDSVQGAWNSGTSYDGRQHGPSSRREGRLFPGPPVDRFQDLRTAMCQACENSA